MKISLCMIVKDEEDVLSRCLESVKDLADEIVIADTGSKDRTLEIAKKFTKFVYPIVWKDDFSAARNFSFSKATGDYLFWLDADDFVPPESRKIFPELKEMLESKSPEYVTAPYDVAFGEENLPLCTFFRERFFKREKNFQWQGRVHECVPPQGKGESFPFRVQHLRSAKDRGMRNLHIYQKWAGEEKLSPRDLFYYGRELYYHALYDEAIAVLEKAILSEGWAVNTIDACRTQALCYLAEKQPERALCALFRSFLYGEPRAFVCCEIANIFLSRKNHREAAFWYQTALGCKDHSAEGDFEEPMCRSLKPQLGLVCCHYALGEIEQAIFWHKKTEETSPRHPSVLYNRDFFKKQNLL